MALVEVPGEILMIWRWTAWDHYRWEFRSGSFDSPSVYLAPFLSKIHNSVLPWCHKHAAKFYRIVFFFWIPNFDTLLLKTPSILNVDLNVLAEKLNYLLLGVSPLPSYYIYPRFLHINTTYSTGDAILKLITLYSILLPLNHPPPAIRSFHRVDSLISMLPLNVFNCSYVIFKYCHFPYSPRLIFFLVLLYVVDQQSRLGEIVIFIVLCYWKINSVLESPCVHVNN